MLLFVIDNLDIIVIIHLSSENNHMHMLII
jgi:hypothetical protein